MKQKYRIDVTTKANVYRNYYNVVVENPMTCETVFRAVENLAPDSEKPRGKPEHLYCYSGDDASKLFCYTAHFARGDGDPIKIAVDAFDEKQAEEGMRRSMHAEYVKEIDRLGIEPAAFWQEHERTKGPLVGGFISIECIVIDGLYIIHGSKGEFHVDTEGVIVFDATNIHSDEWTQNPDYPVEDWKYEVANEDTRLGYEAWCRHKAELESGQ